MTLAFVIAGRQSFAACIILPVARGGFDVAETDIRFEAKDEAGKAVSSETYTLKQRVPAGGWKSFTWRFKSNAMLGTSTIEVYRTR